MDASKLTTHLVALFKNNPISFDMNAEVRCVARNSDSAVTSSSTVQINTSEFAKKGSGARGNSSVNFQKKKILALSFAKINFNFDELKEKLCFLVFHLKYRLPFSSGFSVLKLCKHFNL